MEVNPFLKDMFLVSSKNIQIDKTLLFLKVLLNKYMYASLKILLITICCLQMNSLKTTDNYRRKPGSSVQEGYVIGMVGFA